MSHILFVGFLVVYC